MPARPGGPRLAPARPPARAHLQPLHVLSFQRFGERKNAEEKKGGGRGEKKKKSKPGEGEERNLPFAEGGIVWRRGCQSKRFCFILFVFATEVFGVGLARGKGGWAEGGCRGGGRDLFTASGPSGHDCDAGLLKYLPRSPPGPPCPPGSSSEPSEAALRSTRLFQENSIPPAAWGRREDGPGAPSPPAAGRHPRPHYHYKASGRLSPCLRLGFH